jgi:hypothetical protein
MIDSIFQQRQLATAFESSARKCPVQSLPTVVDNKIEESQVKTKGRVYLTNACA